YNNNGNSFQGQRRFNRSVSRIFNQNRPRSLSNVQQQPQQQQGENRSNQRRGPRQIRLNDFLPEEFRDPSENTRNPPQDFNINTAATTTYTTTPPDALPQRTIFASDKNDNDENETDNSEDLVEFVLNNRNKSEIAALRANISDLQIQLTTYWTYTTSEAITQKLAHTTSELAANLITDRIRQTTTNVGQATSFSIPSTVTTISTIKNQTRDPVDRLEKYILEYLHKCTQHVKKLAKNRIQLAKA
ncbi:unnamed protein product, partial [Rotaria sp. Silwood2]